MGLLDQLWDDTVAGPRPDSGLGKLRKHSTFSFRSNSGKEVESSDGMSGRSSYGEESPDQSKKVTRSIMIIKPRGGNQTVGNNGSAPASPAGSTPPVSPFSGPPLSPFSGGRESNPFRRRSMSDAYEHRAAAAAATTSMSPSSVGDGGRRTGSSTSPRDV